MRKTLLTASLIALGLLGHPLLSQAHDVDHPYGHDCRHGEDQFGGWNRMADRLNLNPKQRQAMNAIEDKYRPEMRDLWQLSSDNRDALAKMEAGDAKLQETADAQGKTMADMIVLKKQMRSEVDKVLTEEQRQTLTSLMTRHRRCTMHQRGEE